MNDSKENPKKKRIDELLLMIGGLEESIRMSLEQKDYGFLDKLKDSKKNYYERLRKVVYGLPEEE